MEEAAFAVRAVYSAFRMQDLQAALFTKANYHPEVLRVLDSNGDGQVTPDEQRLAYATERECVLDSHNASDFYRLHTEWVSAGRAHSE